MFVFYKLKCQVVTKIVHKHVLFLHFLVDSGVVFITFLTSQYYQIVVSIIQLITFMNLELIADTYSNVVLKVNQVVLYSLC